MIYLSLPAPLHQSRQRLLLQLDPILLQLPYQRIVNLGRIRRQNPLLGNRPVENLQHRHAAGDTDQLRHGGVAVRVAVVDECGGAGFFAAVFVLDFELAEREG